ncbi:MAG TPA: GyrI-like domain-containing protein [Bacteroidales bacterium]|nr:GyrI-like domain-containing protein [Bacteroidales bacterium]
MEVKICNPLKTLSFSVETTFNEMMPLVGSVARELCAEAVANKLDITGPVYWVYEGADGNPDTRFKLDICLPVFAPGGYSGKFKFVELPAFKCASAMHYGHWNEVGAIYHHLFDRLAEEKLEYNGVCREIYINSDFADPANNITEVQVGVN